MDIINMQILLIQFFLISKVLFAHISTSNYFWCVCLHQTAISPHIIRYYCFDQHHKYSTITTQYAKILLLLQNVLKYYYYYTMCSNTTIIIAQCDKTTKIDVRTRQCTWWATICQGTGQWGVGSYIELAHTRHKNKSAVLQIRVVFSGITPIQYKIKAHCRLVFCLVSTDADP